MPVLELTDAGLYCPAGDFHIDPWRGAPRAIVTHGHSDHARRGSDAYLCHRDCGPILKSRLGADLNIRTLEHGEALTLGAARVSLHPAGHVLGSVQVRVEVAGEVWVVSGDYKLQADPTCVPFEPVRCHTFITESTFGLPVYQWLPPDDIFAEVNGWWRANQEQGRASVVSAYALGKAQRLLAGVDAALGPIGVHAAVAELLPAYEAAGVKLPPVAVFSEDTAGKLKGGGLVIVPQAALETKAARRLGPIATAAASGWMRVRGRRRWQNAERGFVLSDHADWPGLLRAIAATEAASIGVTHGAAAPLVRFLREVKGLDAWALATSFNGEGGE